MVHSLASYRYASQPGNHRPGGHTHSPGRLTPVRNLLWSSAGVADPRHHQNRYQLSQDFPLYIGSLSKIGTDWQHLLIFDDGVITQWYLNSVLYALATLVLALAISLPAGYALATAKPKARSLLLWLTLVAMLLPISALVLPLFLEMNVVHLVDTPWAVILPTAFFPFGVYLAFVYFAVSLPKDLLAAA